MKKVKDINKGVHMTHKFKTTLALLSLTAALHADISFGITQATFADGDPGYGFNMSTEWSFYKPEAVKGLQIGMVMDMGYFTLGEVKNLNDDAGLLVDLDLLGSYSFAEQGAPLRLYTGIGYGLGIIGSDAYDGLNYQAGAEYNFGDSWGMGLKYIHNDADLSLANVDTDLDIYVLYVNLHPSAKKSTK